MDSPRSPEIPAHHKQPATAHHKPHATTNKPKIPTTVTTSPPRKWKKQKHLSLHDAAFDHLSWRVMPLVQRIWPCHVLQGIPAVTLSREGATWRQITYLESKKKGRNTSNRSRATSADCLFSHNAPAARDTGLRLLFSRVLEISMIFRA